MRKKRGYSSNLLFGTNGVGMKGVAMVYLVEGFVNKYKSFYNFNWQCSCCNRLQVHKQEKDEKLQILRNIQLLSFNVMMDVIMDMIMNLTMKMVMDVMMVGNEGDDGCNIAFLRSCGFITAVGLGCNVSITLCS